MAAIAMNFVSRNANLFVLGYNTLQSGVVHVQSQNPKVFETAYKVRDVFLALNIGAIFWGVVELADSLGGFAIIFIAPENLTRLIGAAASEWVWGLSIVLSPLAWISCTIWAVKEINEYFKPTKDLDQWKDAAINETTLNLGDGTTFVNSDYKVGWGNPEYQVLQQGLYITELVINVALIFFSSNPLVFALNTAALCYSLAKTTEWKWIQVERTFNNVNQAIHDGLLSVKISYLFPLLPSGQPEECSICMDSPQTYYFCNNGHDAYCDGCITRLIYDISPTVFQSSIFTPTVVTESKYGVIQRVYREYEIIIPKTRIPCCPGCRATPENMQLEATTKDFYPGWGTSTRYAEIVLV